MIIYCDKKNQESIFDNFNANVCIQYYLMITLQSNCETARESRSNSQISLATSPDILQTTPTPSIQQQQQRHASIVGLGQLQPHPPARPRKPPRLLHYANLTFQSSMASINRSRSCSPEKPIRIIGKFFH